MIGAQKSDGSEAYFVALTLLLFASLSTFLVANEYPVVSAEVSILMAACMAAGAALGIAVLLGARTAAALFLGAVAALCIDLMYGLEFSEMLLALVPVICLVLAWILRRHIASILSVASSVLLATTLLIPATTADGPAQDRRQLKTGPETAKSSLPVVLHLILDEHIGIDGLPGELAEGFGRWLTDFYVKRGFRIYTGAYSEYFDTHNSLSNLLNFTSDADDWAHLVGGKRQPYLLKESAYFKHLLARGYRLHVYQSDYMNFCRVPDVTYSSCINYSGHKIGSLYNTNLGTIERAQFIFYSFFVGSYYIDRARTVYEDLRRSFPAVPIPAWGQGMSRVGPIPVLPVLTKLESDLRRVTRGNAFFAHLLIPHYPYVLDASCRLRGKIEEWLYNDAPSMHPSKHSLNTANTATTRAERYPRYFAQIRCQQTLLDRLFNAMKEAGVWDDAIVIVHGDHGSRIVQNLPVTMNAARLMPEDFRDAFSTLFAIRSAGQDAGVLRGHRRLQRLLSEAFGIPMSDSPLKVYLRAEDGTTLRPHMLAGFEWGAPATKSGRHQLSSDESDARP